MEKDNKTDTGRQLKREKRREGRDDRKKSVSCIGRKGGKEGGQKRERKKGEREKS